MIRDTKKWAMMMIGWIGIGLISAGVCAAGSEEVFSSEDLRLHKIIENYSQVSDSRETLLQPFMPGMKPAFESAEALDRAIAKARENLFKDPLNSIPPRWRYDFATLRIGIYKSDADWAGFDAMAQNYMKIENLTIDDVRSIYWIAQHYYSNVFPAPRGSGIPAYDSEAFKNHAQEVREQHRHYYEEHYYSPATAIKMLEYIVEHFPGDYFGTFHAKIDLASLYVRSGEEAEKALKLYEEVYDQDLEKLFAVPVIDRRYSDERFLVSGDTVMKEKLKQMAGTQKLTPPYLIGIARKLPDGKAFSELNRIRQKYSDDPEIQKYAEKALKELLDVDDLSNLPASDAK